MASWSINNEDPNNNSMSDIPKPPPPEEIKPPSAASKQKIQRGFWDLLSGIREFFSDLIDLQDGLDKEGTIITIKNNKRVRGANAWLLGCSIMIASLGLDLNSQAVIIGAMLISPLMSPILGVGLAVGINDNEMLGTSSRHFLIAIAIALFTSTLYFLLTPFGDFTPEISARTKPTLLDALVALFGGIAGIISGSRKDKSNAIPGVAIATALMPPLCVTGYGLASFIRHGSNRPDLEILTDLSTWQITFNSFYLFFLNATLVALATFLIVKFLKFPIKQYVDKKESTKIHTAILVFSLILVIPSFFILKGVLKDVNEKNKVEEAMKQCFKTEMKYIDEYDIRQRKDDLELTVKIYAPLLKRSLKSYKDSLQAKLPKAKIDLIPTAEINLQRFQAVESRVDNRLDSIIIAMRKPFIEQSEKEVALAKKIAELTSDTLLERQVEREIMALYGDYIREVHYYHIDTLQSRKQPLLEIDWLQERNNQAIKDRLRSFLKIKTGMEIKMSRTDE